MMELVSSERMQFDSEVVTLVGDPRRCVGIVVVRNPHAVPVKLKRLQLRTAARELLRCGADAIELRVSAPLCAGESAQLRVGAGLPSGTPPGVYEAWLDGMDEQRIPVAIHVLAHRRTRLVPAAVTCAPTPGKKFTIRTTAHNLGNVPALIEARIPLLLHASERGWPDHFHAAARTHGEQGYEAFLNDFVKRIGADEPPVGRAKLLAGSGPLAPGEHCVLEIEVSLPKQLHAGFRYQAIMRIAEARLRMTLHVGAEEDASALQGDP